MVCNLTNFLNKIVEIPSEDIDKLTHYVDIELLKHYIEKEKEEIKKHIDQKGIRYEFENTHYNLKLILERDNEAIDNNRVVKKFIAHILISHNLFINLFYYLRRLIYNNVQGISDIESDRINGKINGMLNYLTMLTKEYVHYINSYDQLKSAPSSKNVQNHSAWSIDIPSSDRLFCLIDDLFYFNECGILIAPLLRTYFEIKCYSTLTNIINENYKNSKTNRSQKMIEFTKSFGFKHFAEWSLYLNVLDMATLDILRRFYDYSSSSIHNGSFFDRIVSHEILYYLNDINFKNCNNIPSDFDLKVNYYLNSNKFNLIDDNPLSRYNRFQPPSNKRVKI